MEYRLLFPITFLIALISLYTNMPDTLDDYQKWKVQYGVSYSGEEDTYRRENYYKTVKQVESHSHQSYGVAVNQFAALTDEEFRRIYLMEAQKSVQDTQNVHIQADIDWTAKGMVSPVRDQGGCLASYAFSAIGSIESLTAIHYKNKVEYSVQQILDCSSGFQNQGCVTGTIQRTLDYVAERGINTEAVYPYKGVVGPCVNQYGKFKISSHVSVTGCANVLNALNRQPLAVMVSGTNWRTYSFGIFSNCTDEINVAALLVGATPTYWRIKNSWGTSWGQNGFIRVDIQKNCGVCRSASYPLP